MRFARNTKYTLHLFNQTHQRAKCTIVKKMPQEKKRIKTRQMKNGTLQLIYSAFFSRSDRTKIKKILNFSNMNFYRSALIYLFRACAKVTASCVSQIVSCFLSVLKRTMASVILIIADIMFFFQRR